MSKRLTSLALVYSLFVFTVAPTLASDHDKRPITKREAPCPTCPPKPQSKRSIDAIERLAYIGRTTQAHVLLPSQRSVRDGVPVNFVSTATGHLAFAVNDLTLNGAMPMVFQRFYASDNQEDRGLGKGWSFAFDDRISIDGGSATLRTGDGSVISFTKDEGGHFVQQGPEPSLYQSFDLHGDTITQHTAEVSRLYKKVTHEYRLSQITDANGNGITIGFEPNGNIKRIEGSGGRLEFQWSDAEPIRLLRVNDSAGRQISFRSDRLLRRITDADGNDWTYVYDRSGLTTAFDPVRRILLRVRYDHAGRVIEAGDGAGVHTYTYDTTPAKVSRRTTVTDPLGVRTVYEQTEEGALTSIQEEGGRLLLEIGYDSFNRPTRLSSSEGEHRIAFDSQNRVTRSTASDGSSKTYSYDEGGRVSAITNGRMRTEFVRDARGNIVAANSTDASQSYRALHDTRGRLLSIQSAAGRRVSNEYDASGNLVAFNTEGIGRIRIERDTAGQILTERFPSGSSIAYGRNARGLVTRKTDNRGSIIFERDSSGAVTRIVRPDNSWVRAGRDYNGRIVRLTSSAGTSRSFVYDARGGLTDYVDSNGIHKRFLYDARGRLASIVDGDGTQTFVERDEKGGVQRLMRSNTNRDRLNNHVAFRASTNRAMVTAQDDCIFGFEPSFDATDQGGLTCWDPFGDFGGGGCDPIDSWNCFSGFTQTYEECAARQRRICEAARDGCGNMAFTQFAGAMAACAFIANANPAAGAICAAAAYFAFLANLSNCEISYQNCLLGIPDRCMR